MTMDRFLYPASMSTIAYAREGARRRISSYAIANEPQTRPQ